MKHTLLITIFLFLYYQGNSQLQCLASNSTTISASTACGQMYGGSVNGATSYVDSYGCVSGNSWIGGEAIYYLDDVVAGEYTFSISGFATDLDLFVLSACDETSCLSNAGARGRSGRAESVTLNLADGENVYLVIDGKFVSSATFWLEIKCNGKICNAFKPISCGRVIRSSNSGSSGATNVINSHSSCGSSGYFGPEVAYYLDTYESPITIDLNPLYRTDLDLFVYDDCKVNLENCIGVSNRSPWGESVYLSSGVTDRDAFILVDSRGGTGTYELAVTCGDPCDKRPTKIGCNSVIHSSTKGKSNNASYYSCDPFSDKGHNWGPEEVFEINLDGTYDIEIDLDIKGNADLNLYLLNSWCDPGSCIAGSKKHSPGYPERIKQKLSKGTYYIVVEGYRGASADFSLSVSGCGCSVEGTLECGKVTHGTVKNGQNNITRMDGACFTKEVALPSEDVTYSFQAKEDGYYSFLLYGLDGGLDLFVTTDCQDPDACVGSSTKTGNQMDVVNLAMSKGDQVLVLVDGLINAKNTDFMLEVICSDGSEPDDMPDDEDEYDEDEDDDEVDPDDDDEIDPDDDIDDELPDEQIIFCGEAFEGTTKDKSSEFKRGDYTCFVSSLDFKGGEDIVEISKLNDGDILNVHMFHGTNSLENLSLFLFDSTMTEVADCKGINFRSDKSVGNGMVIGEYFSDRDDPLPKGRYFAVLDGYNSRVASDYTLSTSCGQIDCESILGLPCGDALVAESTDSSQNNESIYNSDSGALVGYTGPENVYSFCLDSSSSVDISIYGIQASEGTDGDLDLLLVENVCSDTKKVIAYSRNRGTDDERIQVDLAAGEYYVIVEGWNGSKGSFSFKNDICYSSACGKSIKTISKTESQIIENVEISPNPFTDQLNINYESLNSEFVLTVFDVNGRLIQNQVLPSGYNDISTWFTNESSGVYYLKITDGEHSITKSIVRL